jgi:hypothetical protein
MAGTKAVELTGTGVQANGSGSAANGAGKRDYDVEE